LLYQPVPGVSRQRKSARPSLPERSLDMTIVKKLRMVFYLLATMELVLISIAWGRLPLH
jgi:hypothetical protein